MYWFNTILLTREALAESFNEPGTKKRYASWFTSCIATVLLHLAEPLPVHLCSHLWCMPPITRPPLSLQCTAMRLVACRSTVHWSNVKLTPSVHFRAYRFSVLAMSLANLFDIQTPSEYLKALVALMNEYEAFQDETIKPRVWVYSGLIQ